MLAVFPSDNPVKPRVTNVEGMKPYLDVEISKSPEIRRAEKVGLDRLVFRGKLYNSLRREVAKALRNLIDPKGKYDIDTIARENIDVQYVESGGFHAVILLPEDEITPAVWEWIRALKERAVKRAYGTRIFFTDEDDFEKRYKSEAKKLVEYLLRKYTIDAHRTLVDMARRLIREGVDKDRVRLAFIRFLEELERIEREHEDPILREIAKVARQNLKKHYLCKKYCPKKKRLSEDKFGALRWIDRAP